MFLRREFGETMQQIVKTNMAGSRLQGVMKVTAGQGENQEPSRKEAGKEEPWVHYICGKCKTVCQNAASRTSVEQFNKEIVGGKRQATTARAGRPHQEKGGEGLVEGSGNPLLDQSKPSSASACSAQGVNQRSVLRTQEEQITVPLEQLKEGHCLAHGRSKLRRFQGKGARSSSALACRKV